MKTILYAIATFLFLIFASSDAYSCSCMEITQQWEFKRAESVFVGKFIKRNKIRVELKITKAWKGAKAGENISLTYWEFIGCDYDLNFVRGKKYLIYAVPSKEGLIISVDCGRSRAIKDAKEDIKNMDRIEKSN